MPQAEASCDTQPLSPEFLLRLQRQAGNQAVLKLIRAHRQQSSSQAAAQFRHETIEDRDGTTTASRSWFRRIWDWLLRILTFGLIRRRHDDP